ncbi:MAG: hypothetical protein M1828_004071 [Chrysothrix sp. TS-e1954]|nr:MAG: hypothetical protein M1828_004071 [Chrysothrix sp. TS-e1954]
MSSQNSKRPRSPSPDASQYGHNAAKAQPGIFLSQRKTDRASTFLAIYSPSSSNTVTALQSLPHFEGATHRISAFRVPSSQATLNTGSGFSSSNKIRLFSTGLDDDGEKYAAKHVLKMLEEEDVTGSLVVARWYGGVMLGPVRFTHIEEVARGAIARWRSDTAGPESASKRMKSDQETEEQTRLREQADKEGMTKTLERRDQSIKALRGLLAEKKGMVLKEKASESEEQKKAYEAIELPQLRLLDKQRDKTIGFLLKQIDEAEAKSKQKTIECADG